MGKDTNQTLSGKVVAPNLDQLKLEAENSLEFIEYLTDRKILCIPEDVQYDTLASRITEYVQSNMKIELKMG